MKKFSLIIYLLITNALISQNLIFNGDFELGLNNICSCPTGFICNNDAGRVIDGIHPVYADGNMGCVTYGVNYTNSIGAHSGTGYVYFYAGFDQITTTPGINFPVDTVVEIRIWYSGPQGQGGTGQNTVDSRFSLTLDGISVGSSIFVPAGTPWTQYCLRVNITSGNHSFGIRSGGAAQYSIWFDDFNVNYRLPNINLGTDTTLCQGETLTLDATTSNATYLWHDSSTNPTFNVTQQGTYWIATTVNSCSTSDTINVNINPIPTIDLRNDTTLCQGKSLTLDVTTSNATYLWQDNSSSPTFNVTQQGTYWVATTVNNCSTSDTININFNPIPTIDLRNDTTLCQGDTLTLDATTSNATYLWQDNSTNPTFNVTQQGTYRVTATVNNCNRSDTITIQIEECEIILEMPNIFTPNNDGVNDLFIPIISKGIASMNTIIYNRWGNKIFETNNLLIEWDGQNFSEGVYFWNVNYTDVNGVEKNLQDYITIMK